MPVPELVTAVTALPLADLSQFAQWFEEYLADAWDRQLDADITGGRFEEAGCRADAEFDAGRCTPLRSILPRQSPGSRDT